jgi:hypothetical protein
MRYPAVVLMCALALAAIYMPAPERPVPGSEPGTEPPPISICPIVEIGERHTTVSVLSSVSGPGRLSSFAAGSETGAVEFRTGGSGTVTVPAQETEAVDVAGGLVEMPSESTASGVTIRGPEALAAEACADIPTGQSFISGGSTATGSFFEVQLINPYAGEAIVDLTVTTDAGIESDSRFDAVIVPALSTITRDLTQIVPGRENISVNVETTRGSVLAFGRQTTDGELALWQAVAPGLDWWLPVPAGGGLKQMHLATPEASEIEYQVDFYGPEGFVEAHASGVIDPRGDVTIPLAAVTTEAAGVRVTSTGPVVPSLRIASPSGLARTTASPVDAPVWLLPGARAPAGGSGSVVVLNSGLEPVTVTIRTLSGNSLSRSLEVAAEGVLETDLAPADGYRIEASGPVVAMWTSQLDGAGTAAIGIPLQDG